MGSFDTFKDIWTWLASDLIGNEIVTAIILLLILFIGFLSIGVPRRLAAGFMIPVFLGMTFIGYLSWIGWVVIGLTGATFGYMFYRFYEG